MDIPHPHPIYSLLIFFLGRCLSKKRGLWNLGFERDKHVIFVLMMNCHRKFLKISISHKEVHGSINESPWNPDSDSFSVQYPLDLQSLCWFFSHSWVKLVMLYVKCKDKWVIHYWVLTAKCKCVICATVFRNIILTINTILFVENKQEYIYIYIYMYVFFLNYLFLQNKKHRLFCPSSTWLILYEMVLGLEGL